MTASPSNDNASPERGIQELTEELSHVRGELAEAREQQAATAEILRAISGSPMDLHRVFADIAASAARLCDAYDASIFQVDGDCLRLVAHHGPIPAGPIGQFTLSLTREVTQGRAVLEQRTNHVADLQAETDEYPEGSGRARDLGVRTALNVPLIRAGKAIGVIGIRRTEVRLFSDKQVALLQTFANQAVIAIENTRLFEAEQARTRELQEALEYQTATSEVLGVISRSPNELGPVFDVIAQHASTLCGGEHAIVTRYDGALVHLVAQHNPRPGTRSETAAFYPVPAKVSGSAAARAIATASVVHILDVEQENFELSSLETYRRISARAFLCVPMMHRGLPIGSISVSRATPGPFSNRQIDLLRTFADQAVIAIENARLFEAEQASKLELQESLEHQIATSDVLNIISRSPTDAQPVFDAIVESAARLCDASISVVWLYDGELLHYAASQNFTTEVLEHIRKIYPKRPDRSLAAGRAVLDCRINHVPDMLADPAYAHDLAIAGNWRASAAVPMLRDGKPIGAISIGKTEAAPFTERQIQLLTTFADQAVIAVENTRLFEAEQASKRELQESLEYQTATSGVLETISRSPSDVQPVFDMIAQSALRLCDASFCNVFRFDGNLVHFAASYGTSREFREAVCRIDPAPVDMRIDRLGMLGRVVATKSMIHITDLRLERPYLEGHLRLRALVDSAGARTLLNVPMLKENELVGAIAIYRREVKPFTDKQIELVKSFASQAVIAIENARLLNELRETLQQQTATADVLKVISRAAFDLPRVLDTLVESAASLCDSFDTAILQIDGDVLRIVSHRGQIPSVGPVGQATLPLTRAATVGRAVLDRQTIHVADLQSETDEYPEGSAIAKRLGFRTILTAPLLAGSQAIGAITLRRSAVRPFTDRQIELLQTFADQAVIAIENARLFEEVQARTRELAKTIEDLEIASQHKNQFVANMSHELRTPLAAILGYAELIQEGFYEPQGPKSLDALTRIRSNGKHLLGLINTVLDIAKIESGQFTLNMSEYAIQSVVETVRAATESLAQNKKLTLTTSVDKSLPVGLGDEQRLTQVLLNLVGNAIKFTDAGEVSIAAGARNGHFAVSVTDTGPGIPLDQQGRIFEQFHQVDSSNTKAKGGTGLGLAIAKQIVEMHGGRIWVESTVGKGSTFQMDLPTRAEFQKTGP